MNPLRILVICYEDPEYILGGMGMHVRELYRAMAQRSDVEIDILTTGPNDHSIQYLGCMKHHTDKLTCYKHRGFDIAAWYGYDIQLFRTLSRLLAAGKRWDIVHGHEWSSVQLSRAVRDALGIPLVNTIHLCMTVLSGFSGAPGQQLNSSDLYMLQQEMHLVNDPEKLIVCSHAYRRLIEKYFFTDRCVNVIYNGINLDEWNIDNVDTSAFRGKYNIPNRPIALFVGRIAEQKGIRPLLSMIEQYDTGYCVVLCGEVNAATELQKEGWDVTKKIRQLEDSMPDRIRWVGFQHGKDLRDIYASAAVGLMPSIHEPFGIAALEHMAMGVPLIATEVDGLREIVNDNRGKEYAMIIPSNDTYSLVRALSYLEDKDRRSKLISLGLSRVQDFNWDVIADQTVNVYRSALNGS